MIHSILASAEDIFRYTPFHDLSEEGFEVAPISRYPTELPRLAVIQFAINLDPDTTEAGEVTGQLIGTILEPGNLAGKDALTAVLLPNSEPNRQFLITSHDCWWKFRHQYVSSDR